MYKLNERSLKNLAGIHPDLVRIMETAIEDSPCEFTITDGVRTLAQQQAIYAKGRTVEGKIVSNADGVKVKSNHQVKEDGYGWAVDLYPSPDGKVNLNDVEKLKLIAIHIQETACKLDYEIDWGGNWKFKDFPHFELKA